MPKKTYSPSWRMLFLAANPIDTNPLRLGSEIRDIRARLDRNPGKIEVLERHALIYEDLEWVLQKDNPDIVHFAGHGSGNAKTTATESETDRGIKLRSDNEEGIYVLESAEMETARLISNEELDGLFDRLEKKPVCVILNSCYSENQAAIIHQYVPVVIGMSGPVPDEKARIFSSGFYEILAMTEKSPQSSVDEPFFKAFESGRAQMKNSSSEGAKLLTAKFILAKDRTINRVQNKLLKKKEHEPSELISVFYELFDRKTFAKEPCILQCTTRKNWPVRIRSAFETLQLLKLWSVQFEEEPTELAFSNLLNEIERYYQRMSGILTVEKALLEEDNHLALTPDMNLEMDSYQIASINDPLHRTLELYNELLNDYRSDMKEKRQPFEFAYSFCRCGLLPRE